MKGNVKDT